MGTLRSTGDSRILTIDTYVFHLTTDQFRCKDFRPEAYAEKFVEQCNWLNQYGDGGELSDLLHDDLDFEELLFAAFPKDEEVIAKKKERETLKKESMTPQTLARAPSAFNFAEKLAASFNSNANRKFNSTTSANSSIPSRRDSLQSDRSFHSVRSSPDAMTATRTSRRSSSDPGTDSWSTGKKSSLMNLRENHQLVHEGEARWNTPL